MTESLVLKIYMEWNSKIFIFVVVIIFDFVDIGFVSQ